MAGFTGRVMFVCDKPLNMLEMVRCAAWYLDLLVERCGMTLAASATINVPVGM